MTNAEAEFVMIAKAQINLSLRMIERGSFVGLFIDLERISTAYLRNCASECTPAGFLRDVKITLLAP